MAATNQPVSVNNLSLLLTDFNGLYMIRKY